MDGRGRETCSPFLNHFTAAYLAGGVRSEKHSKIIGRLLQSESRQNLKQLTLVAVTTASGRLFQSAAILTVKEEDNIFDLAKALKIILPLPRASESVAMVNSGLFT